jgi:hypothetical protein
MASVQRSPAVAGWATSRGEHEALMDQNCDGAGGGDHRFGRERWVWVTRKCLAAGRLAAGRR